MKKDIIKYILYTLVFAFLHFLEYKSGVYGFSTAFFFALVYHKQNVLILSPLYVGCGVAFNLSWGGALFLASPIIVTFVSIFVHYKLGRTLNVALVSAYAFLSLLVRVGMSANELTQLIKLICGALLSVPLTAIFSFVVNAVLVKGLNYDLSKRERFSFCVCLALLGLGLDYVDVFFFDVCSAVVALLVTLAPAIPCLRVAEVGSAFAVARLLGGSVDAFAWTIILTSITALCPVYHGYLGGVFTVAIKGVAFLLGIADGGYLSLIAPFSGAVITMLIPVKLKKKAYARWGRGQETLVRTTINKNRADVKDKLYSLSSSLFDVASALRTDGERLELNQMDLALEVVERACKRCAHYQKCKKSLGGNGTEIVIQELMGSALETGKASILDASPFLSSRCMSLNGVIMKANEVLYERETAIKKERSVNENKALLKEQVEGVGQVLKDLGDKVGSLVKFDLKLEERLKDAFDESGILAKEIIAYDDGNISFSVREKDLTKTEIRSIVNKAIGAPMWISDKKTGVDGDVALFWEREPKYKVAYGERVSPKGRYGSGDKEAVVRLSSNKIMLCLADGMGHGAEASENSSCAMSLIKSLYKTGFSHETVLESVERLIKVRNKEEFNAIDVAVIDTLSGDVDVIKQGARESYVITPGGIKEISCGSLPLGIVDGVSPVTETVRLTPYDFLVMFSDGVIDGLGKERLEEILSKIDTRNPDEICSRVMENVERIAPEERDDCSMICARLF